MAHLVQLVFLWLGIASGLYLLGRLLALLLRVHWARHAYSAPVAPAAAVGPAAPAATVAPAAVRPASPTADLLDRYRGVMIGLAVGDALGLPAENLPRWLAALRYPSGPAMRHGILRFMRRAGDISDDTQLAIAVARSITPEGRYLHQRFVDELRLWHGFRVGAGRACALAARRLARDPRWSASGYQAEDGCEGIADRESIAGVDSENLPDGEMAWAVNSEGNGAAMRVAPLVLAHVARLAGEAPVAMEASESSGASDSGGASDDREATFDRMLEDVGRNALATHSAELAVAGARFWALFICELLRRPASTAVSPSAASASGSSPISSPPSSGGLPVGQPAHDLWGCAQTLARHCRFPLSDLGEALRGSAPLEERLARLGCSGQVLESLPAALLAVLAAGGDFAVAMTAIFRAGGDTDTVGALAGAALGAWVGLAGIPAAWATGVQHRELLLALADRLSSPAPLGQVRRGQVVEVEGDVARREVDAVVNAWNRNLIPWWLLLPQGVSRAIRRAGGKGAIREVSRRAPLPLGSATETAAYGLAARFVIHVAGIDLLWRGSPVSVRSSVKSALHLARCLGARSVALPLVGAGSGGLTPAAVRRLVLDEMRRQARHFDRLELVLPSFSSCAARRAGG